MKQILLAEDSTMFGRLTKAKLEQVFDLPVYWTKSLEETINVLNLGKNNFSFALLDFNLPDAPHGEVIDEVVNRGISSFVFTSNISDEVRELVWSKKVADYILKDDPNSLDYIITAIQRLYRNEVSLILVVDSSDRYRTKLSELLYVQKYRVLTAKDGKTALNILEQHPDIKLMLTEYFLPDMDGWMFCQKTRNMRKHDELAIIGLSSTSDLNISARFIKSGANDCMIKADLVVEEFYSRVNHCVDTIDLIRKTKEDATKDHLTGLYNRRYFFDAGDKLFSSSKRNQISLVCAILDIDFFKKVNDTHGHDVGDLVIRHVATLLTESTRNTDIVARLGGEEFCMLLVNSNRDGAYRKLEKLRKEIENSAVFFNNGQDSLHITVSIGVSTTEEDSLEQLTKEADLLLYVAKERGRNRVEII